MYQTVEHVDNFPRETLAGIHLTDRVVHLKKHITRLNTKVNT